MTDHIADDELLAMRDIADGLLESSDGRPLGRVADVEIEIEDSGRAYLTRLVVGPEALAGRVSSRLRRPARWLLKSRFEHEVPIAEVERFGPTINLRHEATRYETDRGDAWVQRHILRFIPGNGGPR